MKGYNLTEPTVGKAGLGTPKLSRGVVLVTTRGITSRAVDLGWFLGDPCGVHHATRIGLACFACLATGCLPVGSPPKGRHIVHERALSAVHLSPGASTGTSPYLLAMGPTRVVPALEDDATVAVSDLLDLSDVGSGDSGAAPMEGAEQARTVASDVLFTSLRAGAFATDSRNRIFYSQHDSADWSRGLTPLRRLDLTTGATTDLGVTGTTSSTAEGFLVSPGRGRVFLDGAGQAAVLVDLDGSQGLGAVVKGRTAFIGEDFYFVQDASEDGVQARFAGGSSIRRVREGARVVEVLLSSTGQLGFIPILGDRTPQLLLTLPTEGGASPFSLLATDTVASVTLPSQKGQSEFVSASSDGHWLLFRSALPQSDPDAPRRYRLFLFDWTTGGYTVLDSARVPQGIGRVAEWRPGQNELWFSTTTGGLAIWRPDAAIVALDRVPFQSYREPDGPASLFTRDGRYWFSAEPEEPFARRTIVLGRADALSAPLVPINPQGTVASTHWELDDGRLVMEAWPISPQRSDIFLVDGEVGTVRALASGGHILAVGANRVLALLDWQLSGSTGTLALLDPTQATTTILAEDAYAVDAGASVVGFDSRRVLAPGAQVAFLTRYRLASPFDGLWVAELP